MSGIDKKSLFIPILKTLSSIFIDLLLEMENFNDMDLHWIENSNQNGRI